MTRLVATDSYYFIVYAGIDWKPSYSFWSFNTPINLLIAYILQNSKIKWHCFVAVEIDSWSENKFLSACQAVNQPVR